MVQFHAASQVSCLAEIYRTEGVKSFFKGALSNVLRGAGGALVLVRPQARRTQIRIPLAVLRRVGLRYTHQGMSMGFRWVKPPTLQRLVQQMVQSSGFRPVPIRWADTHCSSRHVATYSMPDH